MKTKWLTTNHNHPTVGTRCSGVGLAPTKVTDGRLGIGHCPDCDLEVQLFKRTPEGPRPGPADAPNFAVTGRVDGRPGVNIETKGESGGFDLTIHIRDGGDSVRALNVRGYVDPTDGTLKLVAEEFDAPVAAYHRASDLARLTVTSRR